MYPYTLTRRGRMARAWGWACAVGASLAIGILTGPYGYGGRPW